MALSETASELRRKYNSNYYHKNKEKLSAYARQYYHDNKERINENREKMWERKAAELDEKEKS